MAGPYSARAAAGFLTTAGAAERFSYNGRTYVFDSWSDGGTISHDVSIPANDLVLTARYRDTGPAPFSGPPAGLAPGGDKLGPVVRLRSRRPARSLPGTVSDPAGVRALRIARPPWLPLVEREHGRLGRSGEVREAALDGRRAETVQAWDMGLEPEARRRLPRGRYTCWSEPKTGSATSRDVRRQAPARASGAEPSRR